MASLVYDVLYLHMICQPGVNVTDLYFIYIWMVSLMYDIRGIARGLIMLKHIIYNIELTDIWPSYFTFQIADSKGADPTARMRRLVCAFVVRMHQSQGLLHRRP